MESILLQLAWSPSTGYPSSTTSLKSVNPTDSAALVSLLSNALVSIATATARADLVLLSEVIRGAEASMTILSAQNILATATNAAVQSQASEAIFKATYNLKKLTQEENLYGNDLNAGGNIFFLVIFACLAIFNIGMVWVSRYHWYNVTFVCGFILELLGFLGRVLALTDNTNMNYFLLQYVCLTILPAFIMGGVYFLFAQNVIVHGRHYSILKPMWYSYFFVFCDVFSLVVQGVGGGMASVASSNKTNTAPGTWTMFAGVLFQVAAMTVFIVFWFEYISRVHFRDAPRVQSDSKYKKKNVINWIKMLLNVNSAEEYKKYELERFYNPRYASVRLRPLVPFYPLAITFGVIVIYIRCIYRVVELKQGFDGFLVTHEAFLMTLDALMIALAGITFVPFHPVFVFGRDNVLKLATIKHNHDEKAGQLEDDDEDENDIDNDREDDEESNSTENAYLIAEMSHKARELA